MSVRQVSFGDTTQTKRQGAFAVITARATIYENYDHVDQATRAKDHTVAIMMNRWDGRIGFPGGNVDESDKDLASAAKRELLEELNYECSVDQLVPLRSDVIGDFITVHAFHLDLGKVEFSRLTDILQAGIHAQHVIAEGTPFWAHLENYKNGKGAINNGLIHLVNSTSLVSAVKEELVEVCNKLGIEIPAASK
jgi:8-oxo-dGTP pyrophosphatase MutT (NUDIX family)